MSGVHERPRGNFVENTVRGLFVAMERAVYADDAAGRNGLLQTLDPRVKLVAMMAIIIAVNMVANILVIAAFLLAAILLAWFSRISLRFAMLPVWISAFTFTGAIAVPALFLTPGESILRLPNLNMDVTAQGVRTAAYLILRVETCSTLAMLLVFSTPWTHVLKALRVFRVPVVFVVILGMAFRYVLLLMETAHEMFESRKSRTIGRLGRGDYRRLAIASSGVLLTKSFQLSGDVFLAMQSRGFRGEVYLLDEFEMAARDWAALALVLAVALAAIVVGRG
jgi:cobalt/nickel transport system permease protein